MTTKRRRQFSPEQKIAILRRHLLEHVPVSDLCDEYQLQPAMFYAWCRFRLKFDPLFRLKSDPPRGSG